VGGGAKVVGVVAGDVDAVEPEGATAVGAVVTGVVLAGAVLAGAVLAGVVVAGPAPAGAADDLPGFASPTATDITPAATRAPAASQRLPREIRTNPASRSISRLTPPSMGGPP
jgi:hypothetical protein